MNKNLFIKLSIEFICILLFSLNLGVGMGILPLMIRKEYSLIEFGVVVGGTAASILGPILYYSLIRNYLTVFNLGLLVGACSLSGLLVAILLNPMVSSIVTPSVLIIGSVLIRIKESEKREIQLHKVNKVGT
ncbi:MAG: hypothetical protein HYZ34_11265 [Ignavibacteriae bacterium]|nr:hypothetical protein [Ignavibacteriota bacterium]